MILKCCCDASKYGYPIEMQYDNNDFFGTQRGIALGSINAKTEEVVDAYTPGDTFEEKSEVFMNILNDKNILLIEQFQEKTDDLEGKYIYYLPYYVQNHTVYQPGILYENIKYSNDKVNNIVVEILLCRNNLNRYIHLMFKSINVPIWDLINDAFYVDTKEVSKQINLEYVTKEEEEEKGISSGYYLEYYDEIGNPYSVWFKEVGDIKKDIIAFRLIDLNVKEKISIKSEE